MGLWDGIQNAQIFDKGSFFGEGMYDVEILRCLTKQTQRSGLAFIAECRVINSNNPGDPIGQTRTWFQSMKNLSVAHSAIKEFAAAVLGFDPKTEKQRIDAELGQKLPAILDGVTGQQNAFAGRVVHLETFITKTREKGTDFTVHRWSPAEGDAYETAALMGHAPSAAAPPITTYAPTPAPAPAPAPAFPNGYAPPQAYAAPAPQPANAAQFAPPPMQAAVGAGAPPVPVWNAQLGRYVLP